MKKKWLIPAFLAFLVVPVFIFAETQNSFSEPCLIPIYNTNFALPAEGGKIVRQNNQLFFARTYLTGCANSADGLEVIPSSNQTNNPSTNTNTNTSTNPQNNQQGNAIVNLLVGDHCLIPVYNLQFAFPPEGGVVIKNGSNLYFVPTYLPECKDKASAGTVVRTATDTNPPVVQPPNTGGGAIVNVALGDVCLVPIYNTNFAFPPEGGHIVKLNGSLYFAKTYLAGCENSTNGGEIVK